MQSIQVVEPTLDGYSGHCHSLVTSLFQALGGRRIDLWSATGSQGLEFASQVVNHPVFRRRIRLLQTLVLYRRLLREGAPVIVTTARRSDLILLDLVAGGRLPANRIFLYFHWLRETPAKLRSLRRLALRQPQINIFGTTASVVDAFKRCGFSQVFLLPYPSPPASAHDARAPLRQLLYAGAARRDKGFALIVDLVELLVREAARRRITVQVSADHYGKIDAQIKSDIARLHATGYAGLSIVPQTLTPQEYAALFPGSICLQPYDQADFRDRVSGVTLDALTHACPVVATAGTWSAALVKSFGAGVELTALSAEGLLQAVTSIESEYARFQAGALAAGQAQNRQSWTPLLERLALARVE